MTDLDSLLDVLLPVFAISAILLTGFNLLCTPRSHRKARRALRRQRRDTRREARRKAREKSKDE